MPWPPTIPPDLARELAELQRWRTPPSVQDQWAIVKEWLDKHQVPVPDLPVVPELRQRHD